MFLTHFPMEVHLKHENFDGMSYLKPLTPTPLTRAHIRPFPTINHYFGLVGEGLPFATLKAIQLTVHPPLRSTSTTSTTVINLGHPYKIYDFRSYITKTMACSTTGTSDVIQKLHYTYGRIRCSPIPRKKNAYDRCSPMFEHLCPFKSWFQSTIYFFCTSYFIVIWFFSVLPAWLKVTSNFDFVLALLSRLHTNLLLLTPCPLGPTHARDHEPQNDLAINERQDPLTYVAPRSRLHMGSFLSQAALLVPNNRDHLLPTDMSWPLSKLSRPFLSSRTHTRQRRLPRCRMPTSPGRHRRDFTIYLVPPFWPHGGFLSHRSKPMPSCFYTNLRNLGYPHSGPYLGTPCKRLSWWNCSSWWRTQHRRSTGSLVSEMAYMAAIFVSSWTPSNLAS